MNREYDTNPRFKFEFHDPYADKDPPFTPRTQLNVSDLDQVILDNVGRARDWSNRDWVLKLREMAEKLILRLDIRVKDATWMKVPTFRVGKMNIKTVGKYRPSRDDYSISETISFNEARLAIMGDAEVALHLLMLLLCAWRHQTGGSGNFDRVARAKMKACGVSIKGKELERIEPEGGFAKALASGGMGKPPVVVKGAAAGGQDQPEEQRPKGRSTNRPYICDCPRPQRVRVGTKEFHAICTKCGKEFHPVAMA